MNIYTLKDIMDLDPSYDQLIWAPYDWSGTILDVLENHRLDDINKVYVTVGLASENSARLIAAYIIGKLYYQLPNPLPIVAAGCLAATKFANGLIESEEIRRIHDELYELAGNWVWGKNNTLHTVSLVVTVCLTTGRDPRKALMYLCRCLVWDFGYTWEAIVEELKTLFLLVGDNR